MDLPLRQELEVLGSDATLLVQTPWRIDFGGDVLLRRGGEVERLEVPTGKAYRLELEDLAAAARGAGAAARPRRRGRPGAGDRRALPGAAEAEEAGVLQPDSA